VKRLAADARLAYYLPSFIEQAPAVADCINRQRALSVQTIQQGWHIHFYYCVAVWVGPSGEKQLRKFASPRTPLLALVLICGRCCNDARPVIMFSHVTPTQ